MAAYEGMAELLARGAWTGDVGPQCPARSLGCAFFAHTVADWTSGAAGHARLLSASSRPLVYAAAGLGGHKRSDKTNLNNGRRRHDI